MAFLVALDLIAVFVFALTGALVASRARLDLIGFMFLACLTGVGGGTLRDLLLGRSPVFWIDSPHILGVACIAGLIVFVLAHKLRSRYAAIVWLDAFALSVAVSAGVFIAQSEGVSAPIIVVMGVITGTFGGLMRDVVANEIPLVLSKRELYVSAAFAGALSGVVVNIIVPGYSAFSVLVAFAITFGLRAGSIQFGWRIPVFKERAPLNNPPLTEYRHRDDPPDPPTD